MNSHMKYDLDKIKKELETLPKFNKQLYLQGYSKDMDPEEGADEGYEVDTREQEYHISLFDIPYINISALQFNEINIELDNFSTPQIDMA